MRNLLLKLVPFLEKILHKKIVFYHLDYTGVAAVQSKMGFWYAGDILDRADIAYGILQNGAVEKDETDLVLKFIEYIKPIGGIFLDIGANSGYYGIMAAWMGKGSIKVHSFEPLKYFRDYLKESVYLNRLESLLTIHEFALGNENQKREMYLSGTGSSFSKDFNDKANLPVENVEIRRLDSVIESEKIAAISFMKIDVEGWELEVLKGSALTLKKDLPVLFIEIAYSLANMGRGYINPQYSSTFEFLASLGYHSFSWKDNQLIPFDHNQKPQGIRMYLFLNLPKHQNFLSDLMQ